MDCTILEFTAGSLKNLFAIMSIVPQEISSKQAQGKKHKGWFSRALVLLLCFLGIAGMHREVRSLCLGRVLSLHSPVCLMVSVSLVVCDNPPILPDYLDA